MKRYIALALLWGGWFWAGNGLADDVPTLLRQLKDPQKSLEERQKIAQSFIMTLKDLGPEASKAAIPGLAGCMKEKDPWIRIYAAQVLASIGNEAAPVLIEALRDGEVRPYASSYLQTLKPEAEIKTLLKLTQFGDVEVAAEAAEILGSIGKPAVPGLRKLLTGMTVQPKIRASKALAKMGPQAKEAVPELVQLLTDKYPHVRRGAVEVLGTIGAETPESAIIQLVDVLRLDADQGVRSSAGTALVRIGKPAVPTVARLLKIPKVQVRVDAADILRQIGPNAKEAVTSLTACLKDPDDAVRRSALDALEKIDPESLFPTLVELMRDANPVVRRDIPALLAKVQTKAKEVVEILVGVLKDDNVAVRHSAALALGDIGPPAEPALPALKQLLAQEDAEFRADVATVLGKIGKAAVPALIEALKDPSGEVRLNAVTALETIGEDAGAAIPTLLKILKEDPVAAVRKAALDALIVIQGKK